MPRKMTSLIAVVILILSACSKRPEQESKSAQSTTAQQSDTPSPSTQPPSGTPPSQADNGQNPTAAASSGQSSTPPPKSDWTEAQPPPPAASDVKPPEMTWKNEAPTPKPQPVVIPAGTHITIRLSEAVDAKKNKSGDSFEGSVDQPVVIAGKTVIPKSTPVSGTIVEAVPAGKLKGEGRLSIALTHIKVQGVSYAISTGIVANRLHGKGKRSAVMIGGGSGAGALVGGLIGGGKGAAIGAAVGGGAGAAGATMTGNEQLAFTAESALTFTLKEPLKLADRPNPTK